MKHLLAVVAVLTVVVCASGMVLADSILDHVGIGISFSPSRTPLLLGIEIGVSSNIGWMHVSLMLSPSGGTLLHATFLFPVGADGPTGTTCLGVAMAAFQHAGSGNIPGKTDLCIGGGLHQRFQSDGGLMLAGGIEFLYPSFVPAPLLLFHGGWRIP